MGIQPGNCWSCGADLTALDYGRADTCGKCGKHTRVCRNCTFYEKGAHNDCREPQAERVVDKERSNFCDYLTPARSAGQGAPTKESLRAAADALFKKKPE